MRARDDPSSGRSVAPPPEVRLRYPGATLTDVETAITAEAFTRLLAALAMTVGIESRIVLTDIVGFTPP